MDALKKLISFLDDIFAQEDGETLDVLGGYIVGELLGDYDGKYSNLYENNPTVQRLGDIASDLEISNGTDAQLISMWQELKQLTDELRFQVRDH